MERESFEDDEVAALLNQYFIAIKVDREERPDIDNYYMDVCQALTGSGGWPLTVLLTPDKKPFFAGTYFPKRQMLGRIGLMEMLQQIGTGWLNNSDRYIDAGEQIVAEIRNHKQDTQPGMLEEELFHRAQAHYKQLFDPKYGGFGSEPKFPTPHNLLFLMSYAQQYGNDEALLMVTKTLDRMYQGGLYDHIGFGFARYSTDEKWLVPHFEKMLYDNALLAMSYLEGYQITGERRFAEIAESIFTYVQRDMTSPEGAFYSAEDADSEGVEGKFYVFTREEVKEALDLDDMHTYCHIYDITPEGNFEGSNIPNLIQGTIEDYARARNLNPLGLRTQLEEMRQKLFDYREQRVHPFKDDKILTSWNGLMIAAMARAAKVLQRAEYADAARKSLEFIWTHLRTEDGSLLTRYRDGDASFTAYLDDYAYLLWGVLELYEATGDAVYVSHAIDLKNRLLEDFWDDEEGGFFFSSMHGEELLDRSKEIVDGALPSGNSVAALQLWKLAAMTMDAQLQERVQRLLHVFAGSASQYPTGHAMYLLAAMQPFQGGKEIVLSGRAEDPALQSMIAAVQQTYLPGAVLIVNIQGEQGDKLRSLLPHLVDKPAQMGDATAYICQNFACREPVTTLEALKELLIVKGRE